MRTELVWISTETYIEYVRYISYESSQAEIVIKWPGLDQVLYASTFNPGFSLAIF